MNSSLVGLRQPVSVEPPSPMPSKSPLPPASPPPGLPDRLIVTIDGPAGTGKSTTARTLAQRLGLDFLDTGAMYRGAAALVIDYRVNRADEHAVCDVVSRSDLQFDWKADPPTLLAFGKPYDNRLRDKDVTDLVSPLAGFPALRAEMVKRQQEIGKTHPRLVTEGRDQGTVVFPDASVKIYLFASSLVRAQRRYEELRKRGVPADVGQLRRDIDDRDQSDRTRKVGPLLAPADAIHVDTSDLTFEQVVLRLEQIVVERVVKSIKA